jgi:hypothetical protein
MSASLDFSARDNIRTGVLPAQPVSSAGTYDEVALIANHCEGRILTLTGIVGGAGPLTGLKVSVAAVHGGTHVDRLIDADFNTATRLLPFCTSNAYQTPSGSAFQFEIDLTGVAELKLYGKSANGATIAIEAGV